MSKRAAQVQGGKDLAGGFGNEMSANSADTPKRATAAQLASRKIKQARQRTRIASPKPASSTSQSFTSPFSAIDPNIVPPTSSTTTNGFSFGQAQSFPQTSSGTGTMTTPQSSFFGDQNNSGPKLFGSQAGSAPSSFSFTPAATQEIKNPFASMSSGFGQSQGSTGGFQGFQGNTFNIPGTAANQDTQNKAGRQAPTGGIFGSSQPPQQTHFTFGATSAPKSASLFSAAPPVSTPTSTSAPIFGQPTGSHIFGVSTPSTNIFSATSQATKPSDEMQMSPPAKGNSTGENRASQFGISQPSFTSSTTQPSIFETSAFKPVAPSTPSTSQPFSSSIFNTPSSGSALFGAMQKPDETPKPTSSSITPTAFSFTPSTAPGSSIFGQASKPEDQAATAITTASSGLSFSTSFPAAAPAPTPAPFSLFGTTTKPKEPSPAPSVTEDKVSPTKSAVPEPLTAPGTSLFGQIAKPPEEPQASSTPASPEAEKAPTGSPSIAPAATASATPFPSTPSGSTSLFGLASKPAETSQPTSIFSTPATSTIASAPTFSFTPSSTSIFQTPAKTASASSDGEKTKESAQSATELYQTKAATDTMPSSTSKPFSSLSQAQQPPSSLFGPSPSPSPFKISAGPEKTPSTSQASSTSLSEKFTPTTTPQPLFAGISNGVAGTTKTMSTSPTKALALKRKQPLIPKSRLASYGPPTIPRELNNDERAEFDTEWRLNALNASFQKRIVEADPKSDDIDALVEFYVRLRENIGVPMGLVVVPKTGKKRKAVEEHGHVAEDFSRNKRTKGLPTITSQHETDAASVSSSPAAGGGSSFFGEKSASASAKFSSTASPSGKRKMTDIEEDASSHSEPGNGNGKRSKSTGESTAGASPLQKSSTNSEKKKGDNGDIGSGSGVSAASDTVTMFATSFVSQSQRGSSPVGFTAPLSSLSSIQDSAEGTATASDSSQGSESENDTERNASVGEEHGEGEEEGESESSATPPATRNGGRSLFDRVERDQSGKPVRQEVLEVEDKVATPSPGEKDSNSTVPSLFAGSKFASSFNSPASIGTPQFSNGFDFKSPGALSPTNASPGTSDAKFPPVIFGSSAGTSTPTAPTVSTTTSILFPKATSSLLPNGSSQLSPLPLSTGTSADVSRATTPNLSEVGAEEPEESTEDLPQVDLLRGGTGEEDENEVFEARVKALKLGVPPDSDDEKPQWLLQGVGLLRILKNKTTGRARILVRADPSGRVLLNTNLVAAINYKSEGSAVRFLVPREPKPEQWIARVKKEDIAVELAKVMEKCKA
ncbi:hypothetical protein ACJ73_07659 [Blastomyces percursus]|uniref:RanBD1 domain-containing protein n=1 Tax=Blastomyces percursus TaxID=1658174 RepID=A0A1J9QLA0_9EURO|nr:hypothetical protein ACJ73_07659 [Blastomyces percursus]